MIEKYTVCFCNKHSKVLVGVSLYMYLNFIATAIGILFSISILFTPADLVFKTVFAFGFGTPMPLIFYLNYSSGKKYMLKRGHSEACSQKIAQMYALRANLWVPLRVVDSDSKPQ